MADGAVQSVVELLVQAIPLIAKEWNMITGLPYDIKAIQSELHDVSAFLKSADKRAENDDQVKEWVNKVRKLAYDIEDVIEEYQLLQKQNAIRKFRDILSQRKRSIAKAVICIRQRATEDCRPRDNYRLDSSHVAELGVVQDVQGTRCIVEDSELVGAQTTKDQIIELLNLQGMDLRRQTIAVLGMRGLGKTTVVSSIYNDTSVKDYFPICAWIVVPRPFSYERMLGNMMKQFSEAAREMARLGRAYAIHDVFHDIVPDNLEDIQSEEISLQDLVRRYLKGKRYMVVFDDVQEKDEEDRDLANYIRGVLPAGNNGSKILMTTRFKNVARAWLDGSYHGLYRLNPLTPDNARELFCKKTFQCNGGVCPPNLQELTDTIVRRCEGLPSMILAISRLLSSRQNDVSEWRKVVQDDPGFYLRDHHLVKLHTILIHDYHDLKHHLKPCLLYFGLFPKGYILDRMRLIRLWIAEGFIERRSLTPEAVAEEYLNELTNMCLVEVVHTDPTGKPKSLRVHNLLHDILLNKLEGMNFCQILPKVNPSVVEKPRRLSIHADVPGPKVDEVLQNIVGPSGRCNIYSLFLIERVNKLVPKVLTKECLKAFHLLRVLDLSNAPIDTLPKGVGKLLNLQYLSLRNTKVRKLPGFVGKLQNLQTLDLKGTFIYKLPTEISMLQKLRHLIARSTAYDPDFSYHTATVAGVQIPEGALMAFKELQKVAFIDVGHRDGVVKELRNLTQLRKLGIVNLWELDGKDLGTVIERMTCLQALSLYAKDKSKTIDFLEHVRFPPQTLKRLYLNGRLASFPGCILQLSNLLKLRLRWSQLQQDPLEVFRVLPNLLELQLLEAYAGSTLEIRSEGFQKLKILHLLDLHNLKFLFISELALPLLEEMSIGESRYLSVPAGIQHLRKLKLLNFYGMPDLFCRSIQSGGQYNSFIRHVPDVFNHHKNERVWHAVKLQ